MKVFTMCSVSVGLWWVRGASHAGIGREAAIDGDDRSGDEPRALESASHKSAPESSSGSPKRRIGVCAMTFLARACSRRLPES